MSVLRYAVPALAAISGAAAQSASCSASTTTIQNQGDAGAVAACTTFTGVVSIATGAPASLSFDGSLKEIQGSLEATNATGVNSISAGSLQSITQNFMLTDMTTLTSLSMSNLNNVGMINWQTLPALQGLSFGDGIANATTINIQDTQIQSLDAVNVKTAGVVNIANNNLLTTIDWQLTNVTNFTIHSNGPNGNGLNASFPNLVGAGSVDISNVSSLVINSLSQVTGLLSVYGSSIQGLQFPNLTSSGGITVQNNAALTNASFPALQTVTGSLQLINNDKLGGTLAFPALTHITGALNLTGSFGSVSMPKINTNGIGGTSTIESTNTLDSATCNEFGSSGSLVGSGLIAGKPIICQGHTTTQGGTTTGSGSGSSTSSSGAAVPLGVASQATLFGATGLLAAMFGLM